MTAERALGQVQEVTTAPTLEEFLTGTDELKAFDSPILSDVNIEVLGQGMVAGSSVRIGSVPIRVGKRVTLVGAGIRSADDDHECGLG